MPKFVDCPLLKIPLAALETLKTECDAFSGKSELMLIPLDLGKENFTSELSKLIPSGFATVDILINNAGLLINKSFSKITAQDFDHIFNVNVKGPFQYSRQKGLP